MHINELIGHTSSQVQHFYIVNYNNNNNYYYNYNNNYNLQCKNVQL